MNRNSVSVLVGVYRFLRGWRWWAVRLRTWKNGGTVHIGVGSYILSADVRVSVGAGGTLIIGNDVCFRRDTTVEVMDRIEIGDNTLIAEMVTIRDHDHRVVPGTLYRKSGFVSAPIIVGRNVWIGNKVTITRGVTIGDNSIVGANAVVTHNIEADTIAGGVPARSIRKLEYGPQLDPDKSARSAQTGVLATESSHIKGAYPASRPRG